MPRPERPSATRAVLWSVTAALALRLLYLREHASSAFFGFPVLDEAYYDGAARALLGGDPGAVLGDGFRPPLYPLFLALCYRIGGPRFDAATAILVQHLLGAATAGLVAWLGVRLCPAPRHATAAGLTAGLLFAAAGPAIYFGGERLIVTLFTFSIALAFALTARALDRPRFGHWAAVGAVVGLAIQSRANAALLVPILVVAAIVGNRTEASSGSAIERRPGWGSAAGLVAGLLVVLLGAASLRVIHGGGFGWLPSAGGVNLYLGNERGADGIVPRQDRPVSYGADYRDSVAVFAEETYVDALARGEVEGPPIPARVSRYWTRRALEEVRADPAGRARLLARKALLLASNRELPNNKSYEFILAEESALLRAMPVRWWLLFALAPLGAIWAFRHGDRRLALVLGGGLLALGAGVVLFFVNSRFRVPLWPGMAALAGVGAVALFDALRRRQLRRLSWMLAGASILALVSFGIARDMDLPGAGRDHYFRSLARLESGDLEGARSDAETASRSRPEDAAVWNQLGNVRLAEGLNVAAFDAYRQAVRLKPGEPRAHNNIGIALERLDRPSEAFRAYDQAIRLEPTYPAAWLNLALLELRAGLDARASSRLERYDALVDPASPSPQRVAAAIRLAQIRDDSARAHRLWTRVPETDHETVRRILSDLDRAVDPHALDSDSS